MVNFLTLLDSEPPLKQGKSVWGNYSLLIILPLFQQILMWSKKLQSLSCAACHFVMKRNVSKTELLYQPPPNKPRTCNDIILNESALQKAKNFTYLGSTVTNNNSLDLKVERRIQAANKAFGSLQQRPWLWHDIKITSKIIEQLFYHLYFTELNAWSFTVGTSGNSPELNNTIFARY